MSLHQHRRLHEEFVPLAQLRTVVERAAARGLQTGFQIVDDDPQHSPFMERFTAALGDIVPPDHIVIVPLAKQGRAERELTAAGGGGTAGPGRERLRRGAGYSVRVARHTLDP